MRIEFKVLALATMLTVGLSACVGSDGSSAGPAGPSAAQAPTGSFNVSPSGGVLMATTVTTLTASGSDPSGGSLTYDWQFGDGQTASGQVDASLDKINVASGSASSFSLTRK